MLLNYKAIQQNKSISSIFRIFKGFSLFLICSLIVPWAGNVYGAFAHLIGASIIFFLLGYSELKRNYTRNSSLIFLEIALLPVICYTILFVYFVKSRIFWLNALYFPISTLLGLWSAKGKKVSLFVSICVIGFGVLLQPYWIKYNTLGTFKDFIDEKVNKDYKMSTLKGEPLENVFNKKYVILDFWTTSCGYCFEQFPKLEQMYNNIQDNDKISLYTVNVPLKRDSIYQAYNLINNLGYNFPCLKIDENTAKLSFGVTAYPTIIVLKDSTQIIYRGSLKFLNFEKLLKME